MSKRWDLSKFWPFMITATVIIAIGLVACELLIVLAGS